MKATTKLLAATVAGIAVCAGSAYSQQEPEKPIGVLSDPIFLVLDSDKDGKLSDIEIEASVEGLRKLDKDSDGSITRKDLIPNDVAALGQVRAERYAFQSPLFLAFDTDQSGEIGPDEIESAPGVLKSLDKNRDGTVTPEEITPDKKATVQRKVEDRLMSYDVDNDGKVSKSELPDRLQKFLMMHDSNGDGALDSEEIRAAVADRTKDKDEPQDIEIPQPPVEPEEPLRLD